MILALAFPNTQQWTRRYYPSTDAVEPYPGLPRAFLWRPTPLWAGVTVMLVGIALILALRPSEFLYWQF